MDFHTINVINISLFIALIASGLGLKLFFANTRYKNTFHKIVLSILAIQAIVAFINFLLPVKESDVVGLLSLVLKSELNFEITTFLFDKVSLIMLSFISFIGFCVYKYSLNYLDKEKNQQKFMQLLILAISASTLLVLSANLILFSISWIALSVSLHLLLEYYSDRPRAIIAARKKFIISRIGDLLLISAIYVLGKQFGTIDLLNLFDLIKNATDNTSLLSLNLAGTLIVIAALLKSTQFPFHSWLPDTLEAPTPVSALMHAGIVNGGGFLLIRLSPIFENTTFPLLIALFFGLITTVFGIFCMWGQTSVKKKLAWSTVGQMGFMIFQCGLGAFSLALVHIIGHGFYKAHAFLTSGEFSKFEETSLEKENSKALILRYLSSFILSIFIIGLTLHLFEVNYSKWPGGSLSLLVLVLALSNLFVNKFKFKTISHAQRAINLIFILLLTIFLEEIAKSNFTINLGEVLTLENRGLAGLSLWIISGITLILLNFLAIIFSSNLDNRFVQNMKYHALNGFYIGLYADRLTKFIWPIKKTIQ